MWFLWFETSWSIKLDSIWDRGWQHIDIRLIWMFCCWTAQRVHISSCFFPSHHHRHRFSQLNHCLLVNLSNQVLLYISSPIAIRFRQHVRLHQGWILLWPSSIHSSCLVCQISRVTQTLSSQCRCCVSYLDDHIAFWAPLIPCLQRIQIWRTMRYAQPCSVSNSLHIMYGICWQNPLHRWLQTTCTTIWPQVQVQQQEVRHGGSSTHSSSNISDCAYLHSHILFDSTGKTEHGSLFFVFGLSKFLPAGLIGHGHWSYRTETRWSSMLDGKVYPFAYDYILNEGRCENHDHQDMFKLIYLHVALNNFLHLSSSAQDWSSVITILISQTLKIREPGSGDMIICILFQTIDLQTSHTSTP